MGYFYEKKQLSGFIKGIAVELKHEGISKKTAFIRYGQNAFLVAVAAVFLPVIGEGLAKSTGLGQTFVGNIFIALSTSLPELVVCITAVKIDAVDLAIGNIFGSNIFNVFILAVDDLFFVRGPILSLVNPNHIISALFAVIMTAVAVIGLMYRAEKKYFLAWDSICIGF